MKVCQVTPEFPPNCGGIGYYAFYLSRQLVKEGHKVQILLRGKRDREAWFEGLRVGEVGIIGRPPFNTYLFGRKLKNEIERLNPDIIHIHSTSMPVIQTRVPIIVTAHWCMKAGIPLFHRPVMTFESLMKNLLLPIYQRNTGRILNACTLLTVVSNSLRNEFRRYYKVDSKVVHNAVDIERFRPTGEQKEDSILFVGSLQAGKGILDLVEIAEGLKRISSRASLCLAGDGPMRSRLQKQIRKRGLSNIILLGPLDHEALVSQYNRSKVFILPTYYEGLPTTVMEAMACELPVVASSVSGIPDLVEDGINGYMVPPGDVEGFVGRIVKLLENPEKQKKFGEAGRKKVIGRFTWPRIAQGFVRLYEELLARNSIS